MELSRHPGSRRGFTLIEMLIVIAIIAILFIVTAVVINPPQLLAQSRDARRVSDLSTVNGAITLYQQQQRGLSGYSLGSLSTAYISVPDPTATSTGNACAGLGMAPSTGYSDHCAASTTYLNASTTGWLPVNFQNIGGGSPFATVPIDPKNQTSTNLYYTYETNGAQWALSAFFESQKYAKNGQATGGIDPTLDEIGPGIATLPEAGRGLIGYWPLNEGSGSSNAIDWSGGNATGTWTGAQVGSSGYYSAGKTSQWAGAFGGVVASDTVNAGDPTQLKASNVTMTAWIKATTTVAGFASIMAKQQAYGMFLSNGTLAVWNWSLGAGYLVSPTNLADGSWHFIACSFQSGATNAYQCYIDGVFKFSFAASINNQLANLEIGSSIPGGGQYFNGEIADARVYSRILSATEIQQIYNAEK